MTRIPLGPLAGNSLGDYLREQRQSARLSLRQLSELAGISNPYLSQIERGLKKPSAEILQQLAKGLEVSAESLYVRAGILDERHGHEAEPLDTRAVIGADPKLTDRQRAALLDIYDSFVGAAKPAGTRAARKAGTPKTGKAATAAQAAARPAAERAGTATAKPAGKPASKSAPPRSASRPTTTTP
ncbi:helix-turn-helix transcriptional regulator [Phycicoccus sp. 3266]|uniref:helix-turn-helix domain-containing protein n=1 Tax=Phycicoccus sp. 3266 TaxID=2817751 RepID=UPI0028657CEC|nr:helix-turn-helix transcriptional regulator [Phycicoccus sp. 3266]MDR6862876.1 transcriptional regulator with XRE-family HTH domain [Phycicoccus sp. 3266]